MPKDHNSKNNRLSIIVPSYNESAEILPFLCQLQSLRKLAYEVILVDAGSTDDTLLLAKNKVDKVIISPKGRAKQMNLGAKHAQGAILWFIHCDTFLPSQSAEKVINAIEEGALWGRFNVMLSGEHYFFPIISALINLRSCITGVCTGDQGIFIARHVFQEIGGYPDLAIMEDIAISKILRKRSPPICLKDKLQTSSRRWQKKGVYRTIFLMWKMRLYYWCGVRTDHLLKLYQ